jgi:hypothetical protein
MLTRFFAAMAIASALGAQTTAGTQKNASMGGTVVNAVKGEPASR